MSNNFYPVNLDISNFNILIIGLGNVGYRKLQGIIDKCKNIKIITKEIDETYLKSISKYDNINLEIREYKWGDIENYNMIFACTNDINAQALIVKEVEIAKKHRFILSNYCKFMENSNFSNMSTLYKKQYGLAISTYNNNPKLSKDIKIKLEKILNENEL